MSGRLIKICGLTRREDVVLCGSLGVDFTGFIFAPSSPRAVTPEFVASMPKTSAFRVGVFAGAAPEAMLDCGETAGLDYFQLHGGESPETCARLGPERVIKVLWPQNCSAGELRDAMERYAPVCAYFLLDAGKSGGGSGTCLPFGALASLNPPRPWFLAGGLGPDTIGQALSLCAPDGVDLNSSLETTPGVKNPVLLRQAVNTIHSFTNARTL